MDRKRIIEAWQHQITEHYPQEQMAEAVAFQATLPRSLTLKFGAVLTNFANYKISLSVKPWTAMELQQVESLWRHQPEDLVSALWDAGLLRLPLVEANSSSCNHDPDRPICVHRIGLGLQFAQVIFDRIDVLWQVFGKPHFESVSEKFYQQLKPPMEFGQNAARTQSDLTMVVETIQKHALAEREALTRLMVKKKARH